MDPSSRENVPPAASDYRSRLDEAKRTAMQEAMAKYRAESRTQAQLRARRKSYSNEPKDTSSMFVHEESSQQSRSDATHITIIKPEPLSIDVPLSKVKEQPSTSPQPLSGNSFAGLLSAHKRKSVEASSLPSRKKAANDHIREGSSADEMNEGRSKKRPFAPAKKPSRKARTSPEQR